MVSKIDSTWNRTRDVLVARVTTTAEVGRLYSFYCTKQTRYVTMDGEGSKWTPKGFYKMFACNNFDIRYIRVYNFDMYIIVLRWFWNIKNLKRSDRNKFWWFVPHASVWTTINLFGNVPMYLGLRIVKCLNCNWFHCVYISNKSSKPGVMWAHANLKYKRIEPKRIREPCRNLVVTYKHYGN